MYLGFVLIVYGKVTDMETTAFGRRVYYLKFSEKEACHTMQGHMGKYQGSSGGRRNERKSTAQSIYCNFFTHTHTKVRQARQVWEI